MTGQADPVPKVFQRSATHQGVGAMLEAVDQKALFDYWHDRVRLKNLPRIGAQEHVPTQVLRDACPNYDELRTVQTASRRQARQRRLN